jgi:hypothetical protein
MTNCDVLVEVLDLSEDVHTYVVLKYTVQVNS